MNIWTKDWWFGPHSLLGRLFGVHSTPAPVPTPVPVTPANVVVTLAVTGSANNNIVPTVLLVPDTAPVLAVSNANNVWTFTLPWNDASTGATLTISAPGCIDPGSVRILFPSVSGPLANVVLQQITRPVAVIQASLGQFDANDPSGGGDVHTTCPPEQVIPPNPTKSWWRGDFGGMTLVNPDGSPQQLPQTVPGRNTTPENMVMTFLIQRYDRQWQDAIITAHCQRSYSHFHAGSPETLMGVDMRQDPATCAQNAALFEYIQSYGNYVSYWGAGSADQFMQNGWAAASPYYMPFLNALIARGPKVTENTILIVCEEMNSCTSGASLLDIVTHLAPICNGNGIDMYLHFTSNVPAWPLPGQAFNDFWSAGMLPLGVKGLCWQSNAYDSAGLQGAHMWDSRDKIAPPGVLVAFETCAYAQLMGAKTEIQGCRTGLELIYCTRAPGSNALAVAGFGNGGRYINGSPI